MECCAVVVWCAVWCIVYLKSSEPQPSAITLADVSHLPKKDISPNIERGPNVANTKFLSSFPLCVITCFSACVVCCVVCRHL